MEHFKEISADSELREEVAGLFCAQRPRGEHSTLTLCPLSDKEESINSAIEEHLIAVTEQEEFDEETESLLSTEVEQDDVSDRVDAEVNFTKVETADMRRLWRKEDEVASQQYKITERPIVITWHNVNGIGSFIKQLRNEGDSYFHPQ
jgi:hypothetical protein